MKVGWQVALLVAGAIFAFALFGCNGKSSGGDDDADGNYNYDGCNYSIDGALKSGIEDPADCLPDDLPPNIHPFAIDAARAFLRLFVGTYKNLQNEPITIDCRPDGNWTFPDVELAESHETLCVFLWELPLTVSLNGVQVDKAMEIFYDGNRFDTGDPRKLPAVDWGLTLPTGERYHLESHWSDEGKFQWYVWERNDSWDDPDPGDYSDDDDLDDDDDTPPDDIWTKVE